MPFAVKPFPPTNKGQKLKLMEGPGNDEDCSWPGSWPESALKVLPGLSWECLIGLWVCSSLCLLTHWIALEVKTEVRDAPKNKELVGMVLNHRQLSALKKKKKNQCPEIPVVKTEKLRWYIMDDSNPFTMRVSYFDHFFTTIYPGITPTCESQAWIHLKKFRFLVMTLQDTCPQAFLYQEDYISPCSPAPPAGSPFLFTFTLSRCLKPALFSLHDVSCSRSQFPSAQKKALIDAPTRQGCYHHIWWAQDDRMCYLHSVGRVWS